MAYHSVGARVQSLKIHQQAVVLARLAEARAAGGEFAPSELVEVFRDASLPPPGRVWNVLNSLKTKGLATSGRAKGMWRLTPIGRHNSETLLADVDLAALEAEAVADRGSFLGRAIHTVVPPALAPPSLMAGLRRFLADHPFETNVFGMTRFPGDDGDQEDPVGPALDVAREACRLHGLELHLASDRAIDDDLWTNVAAHMWASRYGIGFFEDRRGDGVNYNLTIEVGSMLMTGRRCALLRDESISKMPTDLVGRIYKNVDLTRPDSVSNVIHEWIRADLGLGHCAACE